MGFFRRTSSQTERLSAFNRRFACDDFRNLGKKGNANGQKGGLRAIAQFSVNFRYGYDQKVGSRNHYPNTY
jgi:hypothetical protein